MANTLLTLGPFQFIGIALLGIALTVGALLVILRQGEVIEASDGTRFKSKEACISYEATLETLKPLYEENDSNAYKSFGFKQDFIELLKTTGFKDLKTLMKYRDDIQKLVELFKNKG